MTQIIESDANWLIIVIFPFIFFFKRSWHYCDFSLDFPHFCLFFVDSHAQEKWFSRHNDLDIDLWNCQGLYVRVCSLKKIVFNYPFMYKTLLFTTRTAKKSKYKKCVYFSYPRQIEKRCWFFHYAYIKKSHIIDNSQKKVNNVRYY